ncbi:hypothetical protein BU16DRAFT_610330 [Lophium mytilinum]|uniref:Uncharacterized protein n=1 Tax=Lophium mytilinum TaxID=390894 RepID=A0A6A6QTB0_9PEZI|nr:hypothetical protein BU16DRAFT_610330 [Lophium mytilinum]
MVVRDSAYPTAPVHIPTKMAISGTPANARQLHWTQRIALVRHNLHAARRTSDYTFFKTLQAHALIDGIDHVATLNASLDDADAVLSTLDNLNAGIAYVHQDAFKAVYDSAKSQIFRVGHGTGNGSMSTDSKRSLLRVDAGQQREMADHAIDKTANAAISLIEQQPLASQDVVANAWIVGATIIADAVEVCLAGIRDMEDWRDDFIAMEYAWGSVQSAVDGAVAALRGVFSLMERSGSISSVSSSQMGFDNGVLSSRRTSRSSSNASAAFGLIKRAFSHSHGMPGGALNPSPAPASPKGWRTGSVSSVTNPSSLRQSVSAACPTRIPGMPQAPPAVHASHHHIQRLSTIPPTPSAEDVRMSPFFSTAGSGGSKMEGDGDYFKFTSKSSAVDGEGDEGAHWSEADAMHIESLDPLYSPELDQYKLPPPPTLRRLSSAFGGTVGEAIAV